MEQSDAPGEKDLMDLTFDPMRPINSTKRAAFHAWMEDASTESHDAIYAAFQKKVLQNMLSSGGWWFDTVSDSTQLSRLFSFFRRLMFLNENFEKNFHLQFGNILTIILHILSLTFSFP